MGLDRCWGVIGIAGDRSCSELKTVIHCRNCPVYSTAGRRLLERESPPGYQETWLNLLQEVKLIQTAAMLSVVIFRLQNEWLCLPTRYFREVIPVSPIRTLPHRSNEVLLGLVNVRGELRLCISLARLLQLAQPSDPEKDKLSQGSRAFSRMVVVEQEGYWWVFPVDEIHGVHRFSVDEKEEPPASVSHATDTYTVSLFNWQSHKVSLLDDDLLFFTLNRRLMV